MMNDRSARQAADRWCAFLSQNAELAWFWFRQPSRYKEPESGAETERAWSPFPLSSDARLPGTAGIRYHPRYRRFPPARRRSLRHLQSPKHRCVVIFLHIFCVDDVEGMFFTND